MTDATVDTLYCANHPNVATSLRCNKCGKPICAKCAVRTPVGYRCRDCTRAQQQVFETAVWTDYVIAIVIAAPLAAVGGLLANFAGFFVLFIAPAFGGIVAEAVRWAVRRRRSRYLLWSAVAGFVLGCLPLLALPLLGTLLALFSGAARSAGGGLFSLLWPLIYCVMGASTVYARLRGISI